MNSNPERSTIFLFKFGEESHLKEFRNGNPYINTQKYFREVENDMLHRDPYEGCDEIYQPKDVDRFTIKDNDTSETLVFTPENIVSPVIINYGKHSYNVFCMYTLDTLREQGGDLVDQRNLNFGDSFIAVLNAQEFINRFAKAASSAGFNFGCGLVEYFDVKSLSGQTGPFRKPSEFSFQREFRIAISPGSSDPIRLPIGDLTDITTPIYPLADINTSVKYGTR